MEREIKLPSGKTATIAQYKGKHVREAQRMADSDVSKLTFAIIALTTKIDGQPILMEDLDEMDGPDVIALMGEFGGD